jgi:hypothetical protein
MSNPGNKKGTNLPVSVVLPSPNTKKGKEQIAAIAKEVTEKLFPDNNTSNGNEPHVTSFEKDENGNLFAQICRLPGQALNQVKRGTRALGRVGRNAASAVGRQVFRAELAAVGACESVGIPRENIEGLVSMIVLTTLTAFAVGAERERSMEECGRSYCEYVQGEGGARRKTRRSRKY